VSVVRQRQSLMFRARSYMTFSVMPRPPIAEWLSDLDLSLEASKGFFAGYPIVLNLSAVNLSPNGIMQLIANLEERNIRVLGIEGLDPAVPALGLPPLMRGGRDSSALVLPDVSGAAAVSEVSGVSGNAAAPAQTPAAAAATAAAAAAAKREPASLLIEAPVRSGQTIVFIDGDITVLGSVGSGAEIVAGGSIHVYGTLRGRALAGASGNAKARIFCHRVEAELLAIDAYYKTAEDIDDALRRGPAQAWLEGETLKISALN